MIRSFFQSLERERVAYLLISGQAAVLYGAAVFSEDIDLWVDPTTQNVRAVLAALASVSASYYKLTPPFDVQHLARGHGFHFVLPDAIAVYLDVMGRPPRVPAFQDAFAGATVMSTEWGDIPTIGIRHLAALKSTQRLGDYPIISRLALRYIESVGDPTAADYRWALDNIHTSDELEEFLRDDPEAAEHCPAGPLRSFAETVTAGRVPGTPERLDLERWLADRSLALRQADRDYWRPIMAELKELRATGGLMPVGARVRPE